MKTPLDNREADIPPVLGANLKMDRANAWAYLMSNLFVLPGTGTFLAGQKVVGVLQMVAATLGMIMTVCLPIWFFEVLVTKSKMADSWGDPLFLNGLAGIGIFMASWIWSLVGSLILLKRK